MKLTHSNSAGRILNAALDLIAEKGYEATSIREICVRARITRPTLYYFFKSKQGVHRALVAHAMEDLERTVQQGMGTPGTLRDRCKAITRLFFFEAAQHPKLWRFIYNLVWSADSQLATELHESYKATVQRMTKAARQAVARCEIAPGNLEIRMMVLMGAVGETFSNYLVWGRPKLTAKLADELIDAVFDGWTKDRKS
jgi:AcrR family transcriptional regulator